MKTKLSQLEAAANAGDWRGALRIAAKFARLGEHKAAIVRAHEAYDNAGFARQLGRDPRADIDAGIAALRARYKLAAPAPVAPSDDAADGAKTYTAKRNAIRAARAAGADPFEVFEAPDGRWGWRPTVTADGVPDVALDTVNAPAAAPIAEPAPTVAPAAPALPGTRRAANEAAEASARSGTLPAVPDFSAPTHAGYRKHLAAVVALVEAGDVAGLRAYPIAPVSSSRRIIVRYRDLAVIALEARA